MQILALLSATMKGKKKSKFTVWKNAVKNLKHSHIKQV